MQNETVAMKEKEPVSRRSFLGSAAAAISAGAVISAPFAFAQSRSEIFKGEQDHSASNPGPVNKAIAGQNGSSELPPDTDKGDVNPFWYSFDLSHRRVQDGGWTRQVTEKDLPSSRDLAGVNMRLTAGGYRELHWHTANEWAFMIYGNARVTVLNPDGTIFINDVTEGDLWYFPAGFPHSIQGLGPDGCEFLLVFDEGTFSEYQTFLISDWLAHTPPEVISKNFGLPESAVRKLPDDELYIFQGEVPGSLEDDKKAVGGKAVESKIDYTFRMKAMKPTLENASGDVRIVDSSLFTPSKAISGALVRIKPGGMRELHWHPNASEWQYWISGSGRMTVFASSGKARTMNFNPNDVGFVPAVAGHYIENTGTEDLVFLELFRSSYFAEFSLNQWIRRLPLQMAEDHLHLSEGEIEKIPSTKLDVLGR
ncbi:cupin domain-containing protein [Granulicella mallensis]|uniref:Bicupin, oxalate decarboxylase family n=1 Tax=Granulicella mallensis (strain ATCC BAA-1857 / DSM 23137 / MP5ACTX8) TaxID=682795 RepID=G8NWT4_GRAMM|nr:cupin domain-containing protein [Granulicella mallensis]AEU34372.1 bicupin, oxalate decarboxylase family [Granulicella mallensis MP5ACTX8]